MYIYSRDNQTVAFAGVHGRKSDRLPVDWDRKQRRWTTVPVHVLRQWRLRPCRRHVPHSRLAPDASSQEMVARRNVDEDRRPFQTDRRWQRPPRPTVGPLAVVGRRATFDGREVPPNDVVVAVWEAGGVVLVSTEVWERRGRRTAADYSVDRPLSAVLRRTDMQPRWPGRLQVSTTQPRGTVELGISKPAGMPFVCLTLVSDWTVLLLDISPTTWTVSRRRSVQLPWFFQHLGSWLMRTSIEMFRVAIYHG